jgi:hypothetical protein
MTAVGRAGRGRGREVAGPVPVRDLESQDHKVSRWCALLMVARKNGPSPTVGFLNIWQAAPRCAPGASVGFEVPVEHHSHPQRSHAQQPWRSTGADTAAPHPRGRTVYRTMACTLRPVPLDKPASSPRCQAPYPAKVVLVHLCEPVGAKTAMAKARRVTI